MGCVSARHAFLIMASPDVELPRLAPAAVATSDKNMALVMYVRKLLPCFGALPYMVKSFKKPDRCAFIGPRSPPALFEGAMRALNVWAYRAVLHGYCAVVGAPNHPGSQECVSELVPQQSLAGRAQ